MTVRGKDVMPLPPDVRDAVSRLAEGYRYARGMIQSTQVYSCPAYRVPEWVGEAKDAYMESIRRLGKHTHGFAGVFVSPAAALGQWSDAVDVAISKTVPELWERYDQAERNYQGNLQDLAERVQQETDAGRQVSAEEIADEKRTLLELRDEDQANILAEYKAAMTALDAVAGEVAGKFTAALDSFVEPGKQGSRNQVGSALFNDIPVVDGQAEWEQAQELAPQIAKKMKDTGLTPEGLQEFHDKYGSMLSNPFMANALAEQLTPRQMLEFANRVSGFPRENNGVRDEVLKQIGAAMVLATGGMNMSEATAHDQTAFESAKAGLLTGDNRALPDHTRNFMEQLKQTGREKFQYRGLPSYGSDWEVSGYSTLSQIMGEAGKANPGLALGSAFFDAPHGGRSVAQDLVVWDGEERRRRKLPGYMGVPSMFAHDQTMCDPMHAMYTLMDTPEGLESESVNSVLRTVDKARMNGVRGFLASDIDPGLVDANNDGVVDSRDGKINMTRYLTGRRLGGVPSSGNPMNGYSGFQDGGEAFGRVLSQASAKDMDADMSAPNPKAYAGGKEDPEYIKAYEAYNVLKQDDVKRASIAANFMVGYQDGLDKWADDLNGENAFGCSNSALRSYAGTIIAPHIGGVAQALKGLTSSGDEVGAIDSPDGHAMPKFSLTDASRFKARGGIFQDLAFDNPKVIDSGDPRNPFDDKYENGRRPALQMLRIAAQEGYINELEASSKIRDHNRRIDDMKQVVNSWAGITDSLYVAKADADTAMAKAMDLQNQRWKDGIGAVLDAIPFGDFVKEEAKFTKWAVGQGTGQIAPTVLDRAFPTNNEATASLDASIAHGEAGKVIDKGLYKVLASTGGDWQTSTHGQVTGTQPINFTDPEYERMPYVKDGRLLTYEEMEEADEKKRKEGERGEACEKYRDWVRTHTDYRALFDEGNKTLAAAEVNRDSSNDIVKAEANKKQQQEKEQ